MTKIINPKVIEFMEKIRALEAEYDFKIVADDPFCGRLVKDIKTGEVFETNGTYE